MQFRVIVLTDPQTHPQTGLSTIHCAAARAQCNHTRPIFRQVTCNIMHTKNYHVTETYGDQRHLP